MPRFEPGFRASTSDLCAIAAAAAVAAGLIARETKKNKTPRGDEPRGVSFERFAYASLAS